MNRSRNFWRIITGKRTGKKKGALFGRPFSLVIFLFVDFFNNSFKSFRMVHGEVGKGFTVQCDFVFSKFAPKIRI